ncbi:hypothetical protein M9H77_11839 [Catharanthus roseus]|uniref:Uncharacterized protein n=1 Tax=Catharanthus roseus TaxID=4058 RepID=A0ACC0BFS7_CATRO|nr:hypothetical protein M9H77_11839 [Catharanthus roseus]
MFGLSNGSTAPDPSPLSTSTCLRSTCSCLFGKRGTGGRPPLAPRPGCLRAPLLTPRAPQSGWYPTERVSQLAVFPMYNVAIPNAQSPLMPSLYMASMLCTPVSVVMPSDADQDEYHMHPVYAEPVQIDESHARNSDTPLSHNR